MLLSLAASPETENATGRERMPNAMTGVRELMRATPTANEKSHATQPMAVAGHCAQGSGLKQAMQPFGFCDEPLLGRLRALGLCGLTPELSRPAKRVRLE